MIIVLNISLTNIISFESIFKSHLCRNNELKDHNNSILFVLIQKYFKYTRNFNIGVYTPNFFTYLFNLFCFSLNFFHKCLESYYFFF